MVLAVNLHFTDRGSNPLLLKKNPFTRLDELKLKANEKNYLNIF